MMANSVAAATATVTSNNNSINKHIMTDSIVGGCDGAMGGVDAAGW